MVASGQVPTLVGGEGNCPLLPSPVGLPLLGLAFPLGHLPEGWLKMFYQLSHLIWQPWT